jgi:hypothetical protein
MKLLIGWKEMAKITPWSAKTLQQRYQAEMAELGFVFRSILRSKYHKGSSIQYWTTDTLLLAYFTYLQKRYYIVDHRPAFRAKQLQVREARIKARNAYKARQALKEQERNE